MKRLIYTGKRILAEGHNRQDRIDNSPARLVRNAGLIPWFPKPAKEVVDHDVTRKNIIEDGLAR